MCAFRGELMHEFEQAMIGAGLLVTSCIVWDKNSVGLGH
jgi:hypothetical protein